MDAAQLAEVSATVARRSDGEVVNTQRPKSSTEDDHAADDAWLDDALAQSFPASDPVPHSHRGPPRAHHDDSRRE